MLWGIELRKPFKLEPFSSDILFPLPTSSLSPTREALFTAGDPSSSNVLFDEVVLPRAVTGSSDSGMGLAPNMTGLPVDRNMRKVWVRNLAREENVVIYSTGNLIRIRHQNGTSVTFKFLHCWEIYYLLCHLESHPKMGPQWRGTLFVTQWSKDGSGTVGHREGQRDAPQSPWPPESDRKYTGHMQESRTHFAHILAILESK